jgi:L-amino acid N-acyltransferase YncA
VTAGVKLESSNLQSAPQSAPQSTRSLVIEANGNSADHDQHGACEAQDKASEEASVISAGVKLSSNHLQSTSQSASHTERSLINEDGNATAQDELEKPCLPLSIQNLTLSAAKVQEKEQKRILSNSEDSYLLSSWELKDIAFGERMRSWVENANPGQNTEQRATEVTEEPSQEESTHTDRPRTPSVARPPSESQADNESTDSYLVERSLRATDAKKRISALIGKRNSSIKPGVALILRHATSMDANELIILYNHFVRGTHQCLDTKPITVDDMHQRIDESRKEELPFIVAVAMERRNNAAGKVLGSVRLTKFLDGQPSVSQTARLEIMVWHSNRGQNVGRCLMDAMMTFVDPKYSGKGGYAFVPSPVESNDLIFYSSTSCRPLRNLAIFMSYIDAEASRYGRIRDWLKREHKFAEKGNMPSVAQKMIQP